MSSDESSRKEQRTSVETIDSGQAKPTKTDSYIERQPSYVQRGLDALLHQPALLETESQSAPVTNHRHGVETPMRKTVQNDKAFILTREWESALYVPPNKYDTIEVVENSLTSLKGKLKTALSTNGHVEIVLGTQISAAVNFLPSFLNPQNSNITSVKLRFVHGPAYSGSTASTTKQGVSAAIAHQVQSLRRKVAAAQEKLLPQSETVEQSGSELAGFTNSLSLLQTATSILLGLCALNNLTRLCIEGPVDDTLATIFCAVLPKLNIRFLSLRSGTFNTTAGARWQSPRVQVLSIEELEDRRNIAPGPLPLFLNGFADLRHLTIEAFRPVVLSDAPLPNLRSMWLCNVTSLAGDVSYIRELSLEYRHLALQNIDILNVFKDSKIVELGLECALLRGAITTPQSLQIVSLISNQDSTSHIDLSDLPELTHVQVEAIVSLALPANVSATLISLELIRVRSVTGGLSSVTMLNMCKMDSGVVKELLANCKQLQQLGLVLVDFGAEGPDSELELPERTDVVFLRSVRVSDLTIANGARLRALYLSNVSITTPKSLPLIDADFLGLADLCGAQFLNIAHKLQARNILGLLWTPGSRGITEVPVQNVDPDAIMEFVSRLAKVAFLALLLPLPKFANNHVRLWKLKHLFLPRLADLAAAVGVLPEHLTHIGLMHKDDGSATKENDTLKRFLSDRIAAGAYPETIEECDQSAIERRWYESVPGIKVSLASDWFFSQMLPTYTNFH